MFLFTAIQSPNLNASTVYSTSILSSKDNKSVFLDAIKSNKKNAVKTLIDSGHDVNESHSGWVPLMAAVNSGNLEIVQLLVSAGANLESYDNQGNTPLMYAFYDNKDNTEIVKFLLSLNVNTEVMNSSELTPLILAALNNHWKAIGLLITGGVNIEGKGKSGGTALYHAINNGRIEAAKTLVKYGANLETRDEFGLTPFMSAAFNNDGTMIRFLIDSGADVQARTTKSVPVTIKKDMFDYFPKTVYIPIGSTALDIAKQFEKRYAENILSHQKVKK